MNQSDKIREKFLNDNADFLLDELSASLRGVGEFSCQSSYALEYALGMLEDAIRKASDSQQLNASTAHDVVDLIKSGKINLDEAHGLMKVIQAKQEIEELPKLLEKLESLEGGMNGGGALR